MVKVSITLPNAVQISLESDEPELIHEVVGMALRDLPRELMQVNPDSNSGAGQTQVLENGKHVVGGPSTTNSIAAGKQPKDRPDTPSGSPRTGARRRSAQNADTPTTGSQEPVSVQGNPQSAASDAAFAEFCRLADPLGDMRKAVVAAEGANRFLGMDSVDASSLARLFGLAGWRLPHDFTQTLRNAARNKYRWLEREPGRAGRYSATDLGRAATLGQ